LKAKTSYRRHIELIVERLEAKLEELSIRIEARLEAKRGVVESSIEALDEFEGHKGCNDDVDRSTSHTEEPLDSL